MRWEEARREVDAALVAFLAAQPAEMRDVLVPATRGGKRLRPCVLLLVHAACGAPAPERALRHALAVELIHTATLIHDDVVDGDWTRRGRPSTRGELRDALRAMPAARRPDALAALAGDACLALAVGLVREEDALLLVGDALRDAWCGAWREALGASGEEVARGKTARLFRLAAELGALGGPHAAAAGAFGEALGMAYQLADDAADGTPALAVRALALAAEAARLARALPPGAARDALEAAPRRVVRAALPVGGAP